MDPQSRKRRRSIMDEGYAECPFTVITITNDSSDTTPEAWKQHGGSADKKLTQVSPFKPEGKFVSNQSMDMAYTIEPCTRWLDMARYHNFVLHGCKYKTNDFVYVANDESSKAQEPARRQDEGSLPHSTHCWVAKLLEIRASDAHHVYARIFWMYSPEELPPNTRHGEETIAGRQPYHGTDELIASNHMDVINVVSIVAEAQVCQWIESNDDEVHDALYWRQAFNFTTLQLSSAQLICECRAPAHPEELVVGCTREDCRQWLHERCLRHAVLKRVHGRHLTNDGKDSLGCFPLEASELSGSELHDNLFTATLITDDGTIHWEISDRRKNKSGNIVTQKEHVDCLICGTMIE